MEKAFSQNSHEIKFEVQEAIKPGQDGWLTPEGRFYPCNPTEHDECAKYLTSRDTGDKEYLVLASKNSLVYEKKVPPRVKLEEAGFVLIRGKILPSNNFGNLTPEQLDALNEAKIKIIDPVNNAECSTKLIEKTINNLRNKINRIKASGVYKKELDLLLRGLYSREGVAENTTPNKELYNTLRRKGVIYLSEDFTFKTLLDIEEFYKSPLTTSIHLDVFFSSSGEHNNLANKIFEELSKEYKEGVTIESNRGRDEWKYRLLPTENRGVYLMISKHTYSHDGLSGGIYGDLNHLINASLVTPEMVKQRIELLVGSKRGIKINFEGDLNVLSDFINHSSQTS